MPPPGLLAAPRSGGTTSPSKSELIGAARVILDNCGVQFSQNKIVRLVLQFLDRAPRANGHAFFLYLTNAVQMSAEQQQSALLNPDIARAYARLHQLPTSTQFLQRLGSCAARIGRSHGVEPTQVQHQLWGWVNSWPAWVWDLAAEGFDR